uniref:Uncharacterized protein n=1 Tax=Glossina pallidipes TaxID=7398 RepID=A0A1B0A589_GLOPL
MAQQNPIAALRAAIQARANAAVRLGQSPLSAAIFADRGDNYLKDAGHFLVAYSTGNANGEDSWISAHGTIARNTILRMIASTPPTPGVLSKTVRQYARVINTGRLDYIHQCCAHQFPLELLPNGLDGGLINRLQVFCYDGDVIVPLTAEEIISMAAPMRNEDIRTVWVTLTDVQVRAFFTVMASESTYYENEYIRAMFTFIATIGKTSFTEGWVTSRWESLLTDCPTLQEVERVDVQTLVQYSNVFQRNITDYRTKVSALVYNHHLVKSVGLETLARIIQQSRVPHVAGFNAVCELVTRPGAQQRDRYISPAECKLTKSVVSIRNLATGITGIEATQATSDTALSFSLSSYGTDYLRTTAEGNIVYTLRVEGNRDDAG